MMKTRWFSGLSAKLLLLTVLFVMLAEVLIYAPSAGRFRLTFLQNRLSDAHLAVLAVSGSTEQKVRPAMEKTLLLHVGVHAIEARLGQMWLPMLGTDMPPGIDAHHILDDGTFFTLIGDAFMTLMHADNRVLRVIGPSPLDHSVRVEVIMDEKPMRDALLDYSQRILQLSLFISTITAALVYLALQFIIVRPIGELTRSMLRFRAAPEDETTDIEVSRRRDEIGVAKRVLADMQSTVRQALTQRLHLAALGEAVVKINHDLRNILSSAQLVSDRLAESDDPRVRKATPALLQAINRAVALCSQVVLFSQARRPTLEMAAEPLHDLLEEAGDMVLALGETMQQEAPWHWNNTVDPNAHIRGDRRQLLRVFENVTRNAFEAGATEVTLSATETPDCWSILLADNGPGLPPVARENLFLPFKGSARDGGTGLGLAIARELVVAHGGSLRLAATGTTGTRFIVELPKAAWRNERRRQSA